VRHHRLPIPLLAALGATACSDLPTDSTVDVDPLSAGGSLLLKYPHAVPFGW
jgi:hypothetical protein